MPVSLILTMFMFQGILYTPDPELGMITYNFVNNHSINLFWIIYFSIILGRYGSGFGRQIFGF